ncbi:hypothetical protein HH310_25770 [Actinoplanes sp. TBRC 11911]|uniref:hypothetical protein n=1 Tax=Actinoplanes sp. TBRC 11911 TaxID=2729386 RepID=UPI00145D5087|nr:hypothetical protein [Actinoplanes sp. TBRC 11911]NMO54579.1 hypothetical protein [Actinoplanes sp. TBRC 11911]
MVSTRRKRNHDPQTPGGTAQTPGGRTARPGRPRWVAIVAVAVVAAGVGALAARVTQPGGNVSDPAAAPAAASASWTPPPRPSSPAPVPAGGVVPRNGSVTMQGDNGERMLISIVRVEDPELSSFPELKPATGDRLVSVTVNAHNTGTVPFIAQLQKYAWISDERNHWYQRDTTMTTAMAAFPDALVEPDWEFARTIVFEVPRDAELTRLRLTLQPGVAARTAEWTLT